MAEIKIECAYCFNTFEKKNKRGRPRCCDYAIKKGWRILDPGYYVCPDCVEILKLDMEEQ